MKSPIFSKEKLLYFPQKSGIVPIFRKSPSSYISHFCEYTPCCSLINSVSLLGAVLKIMSGGQVLVRLFFKSFSSDFWVEKKTR